MCSAHSFRRRFAWLALVLVSACNSNESAPSRCAPGEELGPDGRCRATDPCEPGESRVGMRCVAPNCEPGQYAQNGMCLSPGVDAARPCSVGSFDHGDGCVVAGVPDDCASGFVHDGDGCVPVLPEQRCPFGEMALPGEVTCRPVADCGSGTWGNIPVDATTQFVDAAHVGPSDGSSDAPWTTLTDAVSAASAGAIVAVAAGTYTERVNVLDVPVKIWGRCPSMVTVRAPDIGNDYNFALFLDADGAEVHDIGVTVQDDGLAVGVTVRDAADVLIERVHIHGTDQGVYVLQNSDGVSQVEIRDSLVEGCSTNLSLNSGALDVVRTTARGASNFGVASLDVPSSVDWGRLSVVGSVVEDNQAAGVACFGCILKVIDSAVRGTYATGLPQSQDGNGINSVHTVRATGLFVSDLTVQRSFISDNEGVGIAVQGGTALIEDTLVADTRESTAQVPGETRAGHGINVTSVPEQDGRPASAVVRRTTVARNHAHGILVGGSSLTLEGVWVHHTKRVELGSFPGIFGVGVQALVAPDQLEVTSLAVRGCVIDNNVNAGISSIDSELIVEATRVTNTAEDDEHVGFGILAATNEMPLLPVVLRDVTVDNSVAAGVVLSGVEVDVAGVEVRNTVANSRGVSMGIGVQYSRPLLGTGAAPTGSIGTLRGLLLENNEDVGVAVFGSEVVIEGAVIRDTTASASGEFGDGVQVQSLLTPARVTLRSVEAVRSARAGISNFGALVEIEAVRLECQLFDLSGEDGDGWFHAFEVGPFNICGCEGAFEACRVQSPGLSPLAPLD